MTFTHFYSFDWIYYFKEGEHDPLGDRIKGKGHQFACNTAAMNLDQLKDSVRSFLGDPSAVLTLHNIESVPDEKTYLFLGGKTDHPIVPKSKS